MFMWSGTINLQNKISLGPSMMEPDCNGNLYKLQENLFGKHGMSDTVPAEVLAAR